MSYEIIYLNYTMTARAWFDRQTKKPRRAMIGPLWDMAGDQKPIGTIIRYGAFVTGIWGGKESDTNSGNGDAFIILKDGTATFDRVWGGAVDPWHCCTSYPGPAPIWRGVKRPIEAKSVDGADAKRPRSCVYEDAAGRIQMGVFDGYSLAGLRDMLFAKGVRNLVMLDGGDSCFLVDDYKVVYDVPASRRRKPPFIIVEWDDEAEAPAPEPPLTILQKLIPTGNKNYTGQGQPVSYVTIHNTGNYSPTARALNHANWLYNGACDDDGNPSFTSYHYTVDSKDIYQSLPDEIQGRHSGGKGNTEGIGIEICVNDKAGFPDACRLAARLTATLLKKHGLTIAAIKQHYDFSTTSPKKNCPAELRSGAWGVTWAQFLGWVQEGLTGTVTPPKPPDLPVLRKGSEGSDVKDMQKLLLSYGQKLPKYGADGDFGTETEKAVKAFQKARGLDTDGVCGPLTWTALGGGV